MQEIREIDLLASFVNLLAEHPPDWVLDALGARGWLPFRRTAAKNSFHPLQIALWE